MVSTGSGTAQELTSTEDTEPRGQAFDPGALVGAAVIVLALIATLAALAIARVFIVPVILAFLLALVFSGPCRWARRRGIPEPLSAAVIVLGLLAGIVATTALLALPVTNWIDDAPNMAREIEYKLKDVAGIAEAVVEAEQQIERAADPADGSGQEPMKVVLDEGGPITTVALNAPLIAAQTVFVLILMYFVLASGSLFYERLVRVMPTFRDKKRAIQIAYDVEREVSRYLLAITTINAGLGVAVGVTLGLMGMPSPLAFGIMAFALNFVPFLGAMVGVVLSFSVALVTLPTLWDAVLVAAVYFALTSLEGQIVTPWLVGKRLSMNTVVILIAVAFWAWLWSIMGMIMAVPLLVTFSVLCRHIDALKPFGAFLTNRDT